MKPELVRLSEDYYVIIGAHLTLKEVQEQFGKEYDEEVCSKSKQKDQKV
jgi:hypothetical protein